MALTREDLGALENTLDAIRMELARVAKAQESLAKDTHEAIDGAKKFLTSLPEPSGRPGAGAALGLLSGLARLGQKQAKTRE